MRFNVLILLAIRAVAGSEDEEGEGEDVVYRLEGGVYRTDAAPMDSGGSEWVVSLSDPDGPLAIMPPYKSGTVFYGVAPAGSGVYVAGTTDIAFAPDYMTVDYDAVLAKIDATGVVLWKEQVGNEKEADGIYYNDVIRAVTSDGNDNVIVAGSTYSLNDQETYAFLSKFDAAGIEVWAHWDVGPGVDDAVTAIVADSNGNAILAGNHGFSSGNMNVFVQCWGPDASGQESGIFWERTFGGPEKDYPTGIAVDLNDDVFVTGVALSSLTFNGVTHDLVGDSNFFLAKYGADGTEVWLRQFGTNVAEVEAQSSVVAGGPSVAVDEATGHIFVTGTTLVEGKAGGHLYKFDTNGNALWSKQITSVVPPGNLGTGNQRDESLTTATHTTSIDVDSKGNVFVGGQTTGWLDYPGSLPAAWSMVGYDVTTKTEGFLAMYAPADGTQKVLSQWQYDTEPADPTPTSGMANSVAGISVLSDDAVFVATTMLYEYSMEGSLVNLPKYTKLSLYKPDPAAPAADNDAVAAAVAAAVGLGTGILVAVIVVPIVVIILLIVGIVCACKHCAKKNVVVQA